MKKSRFVPYKIAKEAERLGYTNKLDALGFYCCRVDVKTGTEYIAWGKYEWDTCGNTGHWVMTDLEAPLWQDITDWLREEKDIELTIIKVPASKLLFQPSVYTISTDHKIIEDDPQEFNDYYDAYENGILIAFNHIHTKGKE